MILGYINNDAVLTRRDAEILTNVHVSFGKLTMEGDLLTDHLTLWEGLEQAKKVNPGLKASLSVIPAEPDAFTHCAASPELREAFARSCARVMKQYHLDGIDLDWEYPCVPSNGMTSSAADRENFTLLCEAIRKEIGDGLLSIAAGADLYYVESVELPRLAEILDYICVMTYDLKCGFHALTGHHSQLYSSTGDIFRNSCDQALRLFEQYGAPREKLLLGAAFYSRQWENIPDRNHGFLQLAKTGGGYGPTYAQLAESYIDQNGYTYYWDDEAKAPYLFNGSTFISYDDPRSIAEKCKYVKERNLGGIFYWNHSSDPTGTLLGVMGEEFGR